ncbi:MAG: biotin-dependent carboxyltransferase family protein [Clostridiales bacterium]|nr:biotin-dependent carboxyltransferase family protein [Candidatus Equinaster intestinalis]
MGIMFHSGGLLTTVQDAGRRGYQRYGLGVSGAVDVHSYVYANILVGNIYNEAVLEATLVGPEIEFTSDSVIAVTGGDLSPAINGKKCEMYRALAVNKGDVLSFGEVKSGCRAYISFAGGLAITPIMGSRSTYIKAHLGGYEGRKLQKGDEIAFRKPYARPKNIEKRFMEPQKFGGEYTVRVLMGPQEESFTDAGIETFLNNPYSVTNNFDRMGYRLTGPKITHVTDGNIITDGITFGAIQVPDTGEPIIMLSDRQTTGGYAKIASVINVDMPFVAQCKAGDKIHFIKTDIETAQNDFCAQIEKYQRLKEYFDADFAAEPVKKGVKKYEVVLSGNTYNVTVERVE